MASVCEEVFNTVPGMVNVHCAATSQAKNIVQEEDNEVFDSQRLRTVPDTPVAGGGISCVRFREPILRRGSVSSMPCSSSLPICVSMLEISSSEM